MGDGEHRAALRQVGQRGEHGGLAVRVQLRRRLVEHDDRRVLDERPRQRHPQPLPARQDGPVLAQRIVDFRDQQGRFSTVDQLQDVPGIGPAIYGELQPLVTV